MRRYARLDPPELDRDERRTRPPMPATDTEMDLQILWFVLVGFFWAATSCSRASTSASGMLLPFLPPQRARAQRDVPTIGPVWDGNEVWLVVAGGATFAAFPAWYATMFSGFYIALLLSSSS